MSEVEKLRALLAEARQTLDEHERHCLIGICELCELAKRIDAALAEPVSDDFRRGAEAMREAAAQGLDRLLTQKKATAIWVGPDEIRALPIPEDEP